jgi:hypothetical protein
MNYTFVRDSKSSFSSISRVYDVYDELKNFKTAFVIGYEIDLEKYFITLLGTGPLYEKYNRSYEDITELEFINMLNSFFEYLPFLDKIDFVDENYYTGEREKKLKHFAELKKENFLVYVTDIEPYYMEDTDMFEGVYSTADKHSNYLIDENIITLNKMENHDAEEYEDYDFDRFIELYYDGTEVSLYCDINFEKLKEYSK